MEKVSKPTLSVCMATYNGEKFIEAQVKSILKQLSDNDELIVCDDQSTDATVNLIKKFADSRIKCFVNPIRLGHVKNFEKAITLSSGSYIFLSDQDDIWPDGRVQEMLKSMSNYGVVTGNFVCFPETCKKRRIDFIKPNSFYSIINIFMGRLPYFGSAMAFSRKEVPYILPFPQCAEAHDIWIALSANIRRTMVHIETTVLQRRLHGRNLTPRGKRSLFRVLRTRFYMLKMLFVSYYRWIKHS